MDPENIPAGDSVPLPVELVNALATYNNHQLEEVMGVFAAIPLDLMSYLQWEFLVGKLLGPVISGFDRRNEPVQRLIHDLALLCDSFGTSIKASVSVLA